MPPKDAEMYKCFMRKATRYFEWGTGGSTFHAAGRQNVESIFAVDSSKDWIAKVAEVPKVTAGIVSGRVNLFHADIGPLKSFGFPLHPGKKKSGYAWYSGASGSMFFRSPS